jgi:hypothetical protein
MASPTPLGSAIAASPGEAAYGGAPRGDASAQIETLRAELDALRATVRQNDDEIDALQLQAAISHRPWYRSIETLVAVFALLLSLSTTVVSGYWARSQNDVAEQRLRQQEIHDSRLELRGLLQALSELERNHNELVTQADPLIAAALSSSYAAETSLLANQAYGVIASIPDHVSSSEYVQVALRLASIYDYDRAEPMFIRAIDTASNVYDYTGATRTYGGLLYQTGKPELGRQQYERALTVWSIFPTDSAAVRDSTDFTTELSWASTLLLNGYCNEVPAHMDKARGYMNKIKIPGNDQFQQQYQALAVQVAQFVPNEISSSA